MAGKLSFKFESWQEIAYVMDVLGDYSDQWKAAKRLRKRLKEKLPKAFRVEPEIQLAAAMYAAGHGLSLAVLGTRVTWAR